MDDQQAASARDLERATQGDREALGRLYDRHGAVVLSLCRLRLHHASISDAEDCCHETFIRAFARLDQVHDAAGFRSWLYAIARNVCAERNRSDRRRTAREMEHHTMIAAVTTSGTSSSSSTAARSASSSFNGAPGATATAEQCAAHQEQLERLTCAMRRLPPREQLALHLNYLDPDPVSAAREALGISRSAFYRTLDRARTMLTDMLREGGADSRSEARSARYSREATE